MDPVYIAVVLFILLWSCLSCCGPVYLVVVPALWFQLLVVPAVVVPAGLVIPVCGP